MIAAARSFICVCESVGSAAMVELDVIPPPLLLVLSYGGPQMPGGSYTLLASSSVTDSVTESVTDSVTDSVTAWAAVTGDIKV